MIYLGSNWYSQLTSPWPLPTQHFPQTLQFDLLFIFPLQSNTTDDVMKTLLAAREMSQFLGQNAEVRAAKKTHFGYLGYIYRKILITKSYQAKPEFKGYEIKFRVMCTLSLKFKRNFALNEASRSKFE